MKKLQTISILGCGWLGLPLARHYLDKGCLVKGSTRTKGKVESLRYAGIIPYLIDLNDEDETDEIADFFASDLMIINFPPSRIADIETVYPRQVEMVLQRTWARHTRAVVFTSSTSVYADGQFPAEESQTLNPEKSSGKALIKAEELVRKVYPQKHIILRLAGLMGPNRHPGRFFAGKNGLTGGGSPVNFVHLDDCILAIDWLVEKECWGETFNLCSPEHPIKKEFYTLAAKSGAYDLPGYSDEEIGGKSVSSEKIIRQTGYRFTFKNPIDALDYCS
ncbi:MAG: NAD-dependent epimerase/dehydratase family protein [Cyclobacteriaceae bacterium]|nr:NAD-dependent epimerase/dehydratase family protein [Cyclobacteriaceae bacterium]